METNLITKLGTDVGAEASTIRGLNYLLDR